MELKEFIKQSLADIVDGVREAEEELAEDVAICFHTNRAYNGYPSVSYKSELREKQAPMTVVEFKVQVQVEEKTSADGKLKASILNVLGGGVSGAASQASATTHELSFSVPMVWKAKSR